MPSTEDQTRLLGSRLAVVGVCLVAVVMAATGTAGLGGAAVVPPAGDAQALRAVAPATPPTEVPPATPEATPRPSAPAQRDFVYTTGRVTIRMTEDGFVPQHILAAVGHDLTLTLVNVDTVPHTFNSEQLGIDVEVAAGETEAVTLEDLDLGDYPFTSEATGDEGPAWTGRITIFI